jgi:hypothetical protein
MKPIGRVEPWSESYRGEQPFLPAVSGKLKLGPDNI